MKVLVLFFVFFFVANTVYSQINPQIFKDIVYAVKDGKTFDLDIYVAKSDKPQPLIVWIHGGAWQTGSKENPPLGLIPYGYALASVNFSSSLDAKFPAQIHEVKAAIRFLRVNASQYGYDSSTIIVWGSSSGGHLAALVATTNRHPELEGTLGQYLKVSSEVQAGIDYYGPTNFFTILNQSTPHGLNVRLPALAYLLGKPVEQAKELATLASPVLQVDKNDPPMFIVHGEQDLQVPINQSIELYSKYKTNGLKVQMEFIPNAGHSSPEYMKTDLFDKIAAFLKHNL